METRVVRFNIKNFLEDLVIYDSPLVKENLMSRFKVVYGDSSKRVRDQIVSYLQNSIVYRENPEITSSIDTIVGNFHM